LLLLVAAWTAVNADEPDSTARPAAECWAIEYSIAAIPPSLDEAAAVAEKPSRRQIHVHGRSTFEVEKDRKIACVITNARVGELAEWTDPGGVNSEYRFHGTGVARVSGRLNADDLKLQVEWKAGLGTGQRLGGVVSQPIFATAWSSEWTLKPFKKRMQFGSGDWTERPAFAGSRLLMIPDSLTGGEPLKLVESVEIHKLPTADLEVRLEGTVGSAARMLKVTVRNLGPDGSPPGEVTVLLPPHVKAASRKQTVERLGGYSLLTFSLDNLNKDGVASFEVAIEQSPQVKPADDEPNVPPMARVCSGGHDPNPGNNGSFLISSQTE
jgi:hypothetical protein